MLPCDTEPPSRLGPCIGRTQERSLDFSKRRSIFSQPEPGQETEYREEGLAHVNLALTEEQQFVRQTFSGLFGKEADPARVRAAEPLGYDPDLWAHLISTGALGVGVSEDKGGGGGGILELALIAEEAGRRLAP